MALHSASAAQPPQSSLMLLCLLLAPASRNRCGTAPCVFAQLIQTIATGQGMLLVSPLAGLFLLLLRSRGDEPPRPSRRARRAGDPQQRQGAALQRQEVGRRRAAHPQRTEFSQFSQPPVEAPRSLWRKCLGAASFGLPAHRCSRLPCCGVPGTRAGTIWDKEEEEAIMEDIQNFCGLVTDFRRGPSRQRLRETLPG